MSDRKDSKRGDREDRSAGPKRREQRDDDEHGDDKPDGPAVPSSVKNFLQSLLRKLRSRSVYDVQGLYEDDFNDISDRYFKNSPWPSAADVSSIVDNDARVLLLYKELASRHIFQRLSPSVKDRVDSFKNYTELFSMIIGMRSDTPELELPAGWMWDMVDEFVWQFQAWHQFRLRARGLSVDDVNQLQQEHNTNTWAPGAVLRQLQLLVKKAQLTQQAAVPAVKPVVDADDLDEPGSPLSDKDSDFDDSKSQDGSSKTHNMFRLLAHFGVVGLLRVHCLLGDYVSGLRALDPIEVKPRGLTEKVLTCHATVYYYLGFAYTMLRRYQDAGKIFQSFLLYMSRHKQKQSRQQQAVQKLVEKMYTLLGVVVSVSTQRVEENLYTNLRGQHMALMDRMAKGEVAAFEEAFNAAAPKFVTVTAPNYAALKEAAEKAAKDAALADVADPTPTEAALVEKAKGAPADGESAAPAGAGAAAAAAPSGPSAQDMTQLQSKRFLAEMTERQRLPEIYSYLKLCTNVSLQKLSDFLHIESKQQCFTELLCLKHKTRSLRWRGGPPASGDWQSSVEVDFYLSQEMVHVAEHKIPRRFGDFFMRQTLRFCDLTETLKAANRQRDKDILAAAKR